MLTKIVFILSSGWKVFHGLSFWLQVCNSANKEQNNKRKTKNVVKI